MAAETQYSYIRLLLLSVVAVSLLRLVGAAGAFHLPEGFFYDFLVRVSPEQERSNKVLIIESSYARGDTPRLAEALAYIESMNPRMVVFTHFPWSASAAFYKNAFERGNVVFGRHLQRSRKSIDEVELVDVPVEATESGVRTALFVVPPGDYGVHRRQYLKMDVGGEEALTIEGAVAKEMGTFGEAFSHHSFLVDFRGSRHAIQRVGMDRIVNRDILPQMVDDHVVLFGYIHPMDAPGLSTPLTPSGDMMAPLEFHAYAIDTAISNTHIELVPGWLVMITSLLVALSAVSIYRKVSVRWSLVCAGLLVSFVLAAGWLSLNALNTLIPVVELGTGAVLVLILAVSCGYQTSEEVLRKTFLNISDTLHERVAVPDIYHADNYWKQLAPLTAQLLGLEVSVLLVKNDKDRLHETVYWGCTRDDIAEPRYDANRDPYARAAEFPRGITPARPYFKHVLDGCVERMMPLRFAGRLEGFWAYQVPKDRLNLDHAFEDHIERLAGQVSELMYHRRAEREHDKPVRFNLLGFMQRGRYENVHTDLMQSVALADHRLSALERFMDQLSTPTAMYDMFGNLLNMNERMRETLAREGLQGFDIAVLDLMVAITGKTIKEVTPFLRRTVLSRESTHVEGVIHGEIGEESVSLTMTPLDAPEGKSRGGLASGAVSSGFLLELVETSSLTRDLKCRNELISAVSERLSGCLEELKVSDTGKVAQMQELLKVGRRCVSAEGSGGAGAGLPANFSTAVRTAIEHASAPASARNVTIHHEDAEDACYVEADIERLHLVLERMLLFLINDVVSDTIINVSTTRDGDSLICTMSNSGYGLPDAKFQDCLTGVRDSEGFSELRELFVSIKAWGATLTGTSDVGKGTTFAIKLQVVL